MGSLFPNVPNVPGVPPLNFNPASIPTIPVALSVDNVAALLGFGAALWGIFDSNNKSVIVSDSVVAVEYKRDWRISNYPIEDGGFVDYNKVSTPFDVKVTFSKGGSTSDRAAFLSAIDAIAGDTNLYSVVTPEKTYLNANVSHYDYRRTAVNGVGLLTVDVWLTEIRLGAQSTFSQTATPSGASQVNGGTVQAVPPTPAEAYFGVTGTAWE